MSNPEFDRPALPRTEIKPLRGWVGLNLKDLWTYRELFWILALREVQLRYRQTILGVAWVVLQPLMTTTIFTLIFGMLLNVQTDNVSYGFFAFAGLLPWGVFSQSLQRAGISLTRDIRLVTRIFFPRIIIPIAGVLSTLVDFLVTLALFILLLVIFKTPVSPNVILFPILLILTLLLAVGVGIIFAALNVYYRDFTYVLPFVIQIWMYASPVVYSSSVIPGSWRWLYDLNPMVGIIDGFRWAFFGTTTFPIDALIRSVILSLVIFLLGLVVFRRLERMFADVI